MSILKFLPKIMSICLILIYLLTLFTRVDFYGNKQI